MKSLELNEQRIAELEQEMKEEATGDEQIELLQSIPTVGPKTSFAFVLYIAAERFENAGQISNCLGLVPRVYMSGQTVRYGESRKEGMDIQGVIGIGRLVIGNIQGRRQTEKAV